jgi:hypothetical protein
MKDFVTLIFPVCWVLFFVVAIRWDNAKPRHFIEDVPITTCWNICREQGTFPKHWDKTGDCLCGFEVKK